MPLQVTNHIDIYAPAATVWEVLTTSKFTTVYMFGCRVESTWHVGDTVIWKMQHEGKEIIPVSGFVKEIHPNVKLVYTVIDPNADMEQTPENHLNVTYELMQKDDVTTLSVTQDGFETAANGEKRFQDIYNNGAGWNPILLQVKDLAERQADV